MNNLSSLPNIGNNLAKRLEDASISSSDELKKLGSRHAFIKLKLAEPDSCINSLYALEGAIQNIRWHHLPKEVKDDLKSFFNSLTV